MPQGDAQVTIAVNGGDPQHYPSIGYHDHNWGNISMLKLMHDWYWARGKIGNYQADTLVESRHDESLWELMYFGHIPRK